MENINDRLDKISEAYTPAKYKASVKKAMKLARELSLEIVKLESEFAKDKSGVGKAVGSSKDITDFFNKNQDGVLGRVDRMTTSLNNLWIDVKKEF